MDVSSSTIKKKANKDLTPAEKKAKRQLKRQLKIQQKRVRLETKLRHAIRRNDSKIEAETRVALAEFIKRNATTCAAEAEASTEIVPCEETTERQFVIWVCSELQRKQPSNNKQLKQAQTEQAVALLRNMTKATQTLGMFKDSNALWGYTRHKFFERAMLVCNSFLKLKPNDGLEVVNDNGELRTSVWNRLCSTRRICSIGCGPGNDAVGVVAFLKAIGKPSPQLERVVLLDWAMNDWKLVVEPLCEIIVPEYLQTVETSSCDISESVLNSERNQQAKGLLINDDKCANVDLFLISYLLTEVRGQWTDFVKEMIVVSKPNTLFYFAEPTPWQLHRVKELFSDSLDFIWLDSSMDQPELQPLDNRLGPGVLLGRKRQVRDES